MSQKRTVHASVLRVGATCAMGQTIASAFFPNFFPDWSPLAAVGIYLGGAFLVAEAIQIIGGLLEDLMNVFKNGRIA